MALDVPLREYWTKQILKSRPRTTYHISRTEPFRLLACIPPKEKENDPPVGGLLIGRTVRTVISTLEPEQPGLVRSLHDSLRLAAATKEPVELKYRVSAGVGAKKRATIVDEGPDKPYLTIFCEEDS
jgi:hypothetical protein